MTASASAYDRFELERWKACLQLLCRPIEDLDAVQRPAALVLHYSGRVMNGGHSSHFESSDAAWDEELLEALKLMGARQHAAILAEAIFLKRGAEQADENEIEQESDYAWELIGDLDSRFESVKPPTDEFLARYFDAHPESFPK